MTKKSEEGRARFHAWRELFETRTGLSEDLRKAAIEYGNQQRLVVGGGGVTERKILFTREIALLQLALEYSSTVAAMDNFKYPTPKPKKVKNARRS